jgi:phosphoglycerate kinase
MPNIGLGMMLQAIIYAKEKAKKYIYLGSAQRPTDTYKLQFTGIEWWNGEIWQTDLDDLKKILENNPKIIYPKDITVLNVKGEKENKKIDNIAEGDYVADIGEESLSDLQKMIKDFSFVLWNGPTGNYEIGFKENTEKLAETLSSSDAEVLIGGGDTVSAIQSLNILDKFSFVSMGGGAMLSFLSGEKLPGLEALIANASRV